MKRGEIGGGKKKGSRGGLKVNGGPKEGTLYLRAKVSALVLALQQSAGFSWLFDN